MADQAPRDALASRQTIPSSPHGSGWRGLLQRNEASVIVATLALVLLIGVLRPNFLQPSQLVDVVRQAVFVGVLASALSFLLAMREIDLSIDASFALTLVSAALLIKAGLDPWLAAIAALGLGGLLGAFNAIVIQFVRIPSLIATLATLSLFRCFAVWFSPSAAAVRWSVYRSSIRSSPFSVACSCWAYRFPSGHWRSW